MTVSTGEQDAPLFEEWLELRNGCLCCSIKLVTLMFLYMYTLHQLSLMNPLDGEWHVCTQARAISLGHYMYRPALSFALLSIHFHFCLHVFRNIR